MPYELSMIGRSSDWKIPGGGSIRTCGPSDLVILIAFANRPQDWTDIRGVLTRSADKLNWPLIETELAMLAELKEEPEILDQLSQLKLKTKN